MILSRGAAAEAPKKTDNRKPARLEAVVIRGASKGLVGLPTLADTRRSIDEGDLSLTVIEAEMGEDESDDEKQDEDEIK